LFFDRYGPEEGKIEQKMKAMVHHIKVQCEKQEMMKVGKGRYPIEM
jgi:hypothetical protein